MFYLQEKFVFQEDLTISNGDDVGWDVSGDITSLGFDDWKGGQGTSSEIVRDLGCTFQKTRVEVENITWVGLKFYIRVVYEIVVSNLLHVLVDVSKGETFDGKQRLAWTNRHRR